MSESEQEQTAFLRVLKTRLDMQAQGLDADTLRDLRLARSMALAKLDKPRFRWQPLALGAMAMLVLLVLGMQFTQVKPPAAPGAMEDMRLLSAKDDLDLYENLEFYQWLEQEKHNS